MNSPPADQPLHDENEPHATWFLSYTDAARVLGLSRTQMYRLQDAGRLAPPDVLIAPDTWGWSIDRALRFGQDTLRLDFDGTPLATPSDGTLRRHPELIKEKYTQRAQVYLSSWVCSAVYSQKKDSVFFMRKRGDFPNAAARIGTQPNKRGRYGWEEDPVIEFGFQTRRMTDDKLDLWMVRRTLDFGLPVTDPIVSRRVDADGDVAEAVAFADRYWEAAHPADPDAAPELLAPPADMAPYARRLALEAIDLATERADLQQQLSPTDVARLRLLVRNPPPA